MRKGLFIILLSLCRMLSAGPWYTGPLLAPSGHTIPNGHTNLELYVFHTVLKGNYTSNGSITQTPCDSSNVGNVVFSHGITDRMDVQISPSYAYNINKGQSYHHIGETSAILGYQLLEQKDSRFRPDIRMTVGEIIPTGKYEQLDPVNMGTDATGLGSYQTVYNLNFQHLARINDINYLRTRLSIGYVNAHDVRIHGTSSYGGSANTWGKISLGNQSSVDLAGELSLTQHWVLVMEGFASKRRPTAFRGFPGTNPDGSFATIASLGQGLSKQLTLAPAIEYNFNSNMGLIIGRWFTLRGKNTAEFSSLVAAFNMYW